MGLVARFVRDLTRYCDAHGVTVLVGGDWEWLRTTGRGMYYTQGGAGWTLPSKSMFFVIYHCSIHAPRPGAATGRCHAVTPPLHGSDPVAAPDTAPHPQTSDGACGTRTVTRLTSCRRCRGGVFLTNVL